MSKHLDLETVREQLTKPGDTLRLHLQYGRTGFVRCRLWHPDGITLGTAGGGGYDKRGAALGEAIAKLFAPELRAVFGAGGEVTVTRYEGDRAEKVHGWGVGKDGAVWLDGACGYECMLDVLRALGFEVAMYSTGRDADEVKR